MDNHYQLSDDAFLNQFQTCKLPEALFDHEAHLRLAWLHISKYGPKQAIQNVSDQILRYTQHLGAEDIFHKTVTVAAVKAVHHFMEKAKSETFADFIAEYPRLKTNMMDLLAQHYSFNIFQNDEARQRFLEPDIAPFD